MKFEDFINEAENTSSFEELISKDFFIFFFLFKQNCNENFFAPPVAVAAIVANVKIGNRYLELLTKEKEKFNTAALEEKYGFLHDQAISDATGKTFQLAELLHERGGIFFRRHACRHCPARLDDRMSAARLHFRSNWPA